MDAMAETQTSDQPSTCTPQSPNCPVKSETPSEFRDGHRAHSIDPRVDSGYSSLTATPATEGSSGTSSGRFKRYSNEGDEAGNCVKLLFSPRSDLICFEKPLDNTTLQWFEDTRPRIEQLLVEFLKSGRRLLSDKYKPIAVRLMMLGQGESSARPHLVAFAPSKGTRKVEKFFAREDVRELLVPGSGSSLIPVVVTAHTTGFLMCRISDVKALCSKERSNGYQPLRHTLCGLPIMVNSRRVTFGGIIRIRLLGSDSPSDWKYYGLSASHFNNKEDDTQSESDDQSDLEINVDAKDDPVWSPPTVRPLIPPPFEPGTRSWDWREAMTLGNVIEFDDAPDPARPDLDWCLIHMNYLLPNFLDSMENQGVSYRKADLVAPNSTSTVSSRNVVVASGTRGLQRGKLHSSPARVLLGRSETFSNAYILKLENGTIEEGDSGSWVIDPVTSEVLGHVAAKDVFGDTYVIPMADTLEDIKSHLGCVDVDFPSSIDILQEQKAIVTLPQIEASSPRPPKTPPPQDSPIDSGYVTKAQCTPQAPSTTEIHALIRASLPQEPGASPQEELSFDRASSSFNPFERQTSTLARRILKWESPTASPPPKKAKYNSLGSDTGTDEGAHKCAWSIE